MSRPRILFVTRNFPPSVGGIETMAMELAQRARDCGVDVFLLHIGQRPCPNPPSGLVAYRHLPGTHRFGALLISLFAVPYFAFRHRASRVVNMQVVTAPGSLLARLLLRVPYTVMALGLEMLVPQGRGTALSWRGMAVRGATLVISISRYTDSLVARFGVPASRRAVLTLGTRVWPPIPKDPEAAFGPVPAGAFICLTLTRLVPRKGVDTALEAIARVLRVRKDILYCVAGSGPDLERLEMKARELGLGEHVRFLGRVPDERLGLLYASADLYMLPSRTVADPPDVEGFGIVFLEAGACGTPSLGGNSGGIPDAIDDGVTGYLVDPLDPGDLADKLLRLMEDRTLLAKLATAARARAQASTWETVTAGYWRKLAE